MNVLIRVDSSTEIGSGHVMRCLTLARKLRNMGAEVTFVCSELQGNLIKLITKEFMVLSLIIPDAVQKVGSDEDFFQSWLDLGWELDVEYIKNYLKADQNKLDWLIVDHYGIDRRWECSLRPFFKKIMVIDDLANRRHYCDVLLDQNFYSNPQARYEGLVPRSCMLYLGPQYALLRPEFEVERRQFKKQNGFVKKIMVFFGGSDPTNETCKALKALATFNAKDIEIDVVVGDQNKNKRKIKDLCRGNPNMNYFCQVDKMAELMVEADLAIGAGGTTTWERLYMGLPTLTIVVAENQKDTINDLANYGAIWNLGWYEDVSEEKLVSAIKYIFDNPQFLKELEDKSLTLIRKAENERMVEEVFREGSLDFLTEKIHLCTNTLVTSVAAKVPLVNALRNAYEKMGIDGKIVGADVNPNCVAKYFVDTFWLMPELDELNVEELIRFCQEEQIRCIIPTRDGELLYFAEHKDRLNTVGIEVMISNRKAVETCLDKLLFSANLSLSGFPVIETTDNINVLNCEWYVVKERYGAGSRSIGLGLSREEAVIHAQQLIRPIFQPFVQGEEYSVDIYIAKNGRTKGVIVRKRELVVHGESQITITVGMPKLEELGAKLAEKLGLYGHVVMQVIVDAHGGFHVIECNSRFGGASTLSIAAGLDTFYWFLLESQGADLDGYPFFRSANEKRQIRYAEDRILE